jgi:hypothetical protein
MPVGGVVPNLIPVGAVRGEPAALKE